MKEEVIFSPHFDECFSFLKGFSHHTSTDLFLKTNTTHTTHVCDDFFNRITILCYRIPDDIKLNKFLEFLQVQA